MNKAMSQEGVQDVELVEGTVNVWVFYKDICS